MRAIGAALVVIAGAAVLLWFANTSNSWVLAGLIGGVSGVFLSVPISLTLYSYLNRTPLSAAAPSLSNAPMSQANVTAVFPSMQYDTSSNWNGQSGYATMPVDPYQWSPNSTYPPQYPSQQEQQTYGNGSSPVFPY
jgi:cell division protein FtsW (lipid II flippase)